MPNSAVRERRYANIDALMAALAADIRADLRAAIQYAGSASLVVPGGHTPVPLFERLAAMPLPWDRVWITLGDERWVNAGDPASNEKLVRDHLLQRQAAAARFVGLWNEADDARKAAPASWAGLAAVPRPFDRVILGMGDDGHTASLFPDSPGLAAALDARGVPGCVLMTSKVPPHARISLNLAALLQARCITLLLVGAEKWVTYQRARAGDAALQMPVRALLAQQRVPVTVYWAPGTQTLPNSRLPTAP